MQFGNVEFRSLFRRGRVRCGHCIPALNLGLRARVKTRARLDGVLHATEDVRVSSAHLQRVSSAFAQLSRPVNEHLKTFHDPACTAGKVN
jgi:hypothetical protein